MAAAAASLIVAPILATAWLVEMPVRNAAVWVRPGVSCIPAATPAVPLGHLAEPLRGAQQPVAPRALPDARNRPPSCTPQKVIRT
jgi:hypothetical protein